MILFGVLIAQSARELGHSSNHGLKMHSSAERTHHIDELGVNSQAPVEHSEDYTLLTEFP
jgi:hypothetical protein